MAIGVACLALAGIAPAVCSAAGPALPIEGRATTVLPMARLDGQAVEVIAFDSPAAPHEVLAQARTRWSEGGRMPVVETSHGHDAHGWQVVSRFGPGGLETLQVRSRGSGSHGFLTRWPAGATAAALPLPAWLAGEPQVLRALQTRDPGRRGSAWVVMWSADVERAIALLEAGLARAGFRRDPVVGAPFTASALRLWRRTREEVLVSVARRGERTLGFVQHLEEDR